MFVATGRRRCRRPVATVPIALQDLQVGLLNGGMSGPQASLTACEVEIGANERNIMATNISDPEQSQARLRLGPVLREIGTLAATLLAGLLLTALIVFAPRLLLASAPLAGTGPRDIIGMAELREYLVVVGDYLRGLVAGSLGVDRRGAPVARTLLPAARRSLELLGVGLALALPLGIAWGVLLANTRRRLLRALLFGLNTLLNSLPSFVVMLLAIEGVATLTLRTGIQLTYVQGYGLDRHLLLPAGVLALRGAAYLARAVQVGQEEIMQQDWIRAARARGLGGLSLWRRHVLPALRLPLLGGTLGMLRVLVGGSVIVDYLYNWNGLGSQMLSAATGLSARFGNDQLTAGAVVLLVLLFAALDALGRVALRGADPRLRQGVGE